MAEDGHQWENCEGRFLKAAGQKEPVEKLSQRKKARACREEKGRAAMELGHVEVTAPKGGSRGVHTAGSADAPLACSLGL